MRSNSVYLFLSYTAALCYVYYFLQSISYPESNIILVKASANSWFILFVATFMQNDLKAVTFSKGLQGLLMCGLIFTFVGTLLF